MISNTSDYDFCPFNSCLNLLSTLDSKNWFMGMRTSWHLRALLMNSAACTCSLALSTSFRTFQACNTLWHPASRIVRFIRNAKNIFIFHSTQRFRPAKQGASYNLTKYPIAKTLTRVLQQFRSAPQTHDGKYPLDGTWCQRNNYKSSYKVEITPEETDR